MAFYRRTASARPSSVEPTPAMHPLVVIETGNENLCCYSFPVFLSIFAHVSLRVIVLLKTSLPALVSGSGAK